jgi:hypothetical protein
MNDRGEAEARIVPATVHGDSGVTAVVAESQAPRQRTSRQSEVEDVALIEGKTGEKS